MLEPKGKFKRCLNAEDPLGFQLYAFDDLGTLAVQLIGIPGVGFLLAVL
jgi:hypothetical protein